MKCRMYVKMVNSRFGDPILQSLPKIQMWLHCLHFYEELKSARWTRRRSLDWWLAWGSRSPRTLPTSRPATVQVSQATRISSESNNARRVFQMSEGPWKASGRRWLRWSCTSGWSWTRSGHCWPGSTPRDSSQKLSCTGTNTKRPWR